VSSLSLSLFLNLFSCIQRFQWWVPNETIFATIMFLWHFPICTIVNLKIRSSLTLVRKNLVSFNRVRSLDLIVLKDLHVIAKLSGDLIEELLLKLQLCCPALNILIRQLQWHDDHFWLLDYGFLVDFKSKKPLVMEMLRLT
jgi:hypothetical protein